MVEWCFMLADDPLHDCVKSSTLQAYGLKPLCCIQLVNYHA